MNNGNTSPDEGEVRTVTERLRELSPALATLWKVTEFSRIFSAVVFFAGPLFALVSWLFDLLKHTFDPERYPHVLKEWYFYVVLVLVFVGVTFPIWRLCEWGRNRLLNCLKTDR